MSDLTNWLKSHNCGGILSWSDQVTAAKLFNTTVHQVEETALKADILPARYERNQQLISTADQYRIFRSHITIVGLGGLGGFVIEELARLGVGSLTIIDPDRFVEHNLNRQLFATRETIDRPKVDVASERLAQINPAIAVKPIQVALSADNATSLLTGTEIVVDCLDSINDRLILSTSCSKLQIPLVHGAVAGWYGSVATQKAEDDLICRLYQHQQDQAGLENKLGTLVCTVAVVASLEVAEVLKIILKQKDNLCTRLLSVDLENFDWG